MYTVLCRTGGSKPGAAPSACLRPPLKKSLPSRAGCIRSHGSLPVLERQPTRVDVPQAVQQLRPPTRRAGEQESSPSRLPEFFRALRPLSPSTIADSSSVPDPSLPQIPTADPQTNNQKNEQKTAVGPAMLFLRRACRQHSLPSSPPSPPPVQIPIASLFRPEAILLGPTGFCSVDFFACA
jgi:hypothetical protein